MVPEFITNFPAKLRQLFLFWFSILKLRWDAAAASLNLRGFLRRNGVRRRGPRGFSVLIGLSICTAAAAGAITLSVWVQHAPQLLNLDGSIPRAQDVIILDPSRKDEFSLSPGRLYDRPIAALQTGTEQVLLRVRLESTLLTVARDDKGLIIVSRTAKDPGEDYIPRSMPQDTVQQMLIANGFFKKNTAWTEMLDQKVTSKRLPGGSNDGGRLLVFEKKTVVQNPDAAVPDLSVILPEDLEKMNLSRTTYSYMGVYQLSDAGETPLYQPVHLTLKDTDSTHQKPPIIQSVAYEFFQWDVSNRQVHLFAEGAESPVALQIGTVPPLRPLAEWQAPTDGWFYDEDGWVYYGQALMPGVMTPLLLESFSVGPESPLLKDETRYRLRVRAQSAPLEREQILALWHSGKSLEGLGFNHMSNEAARFAAEMLQ